MEARRHDDREALYWCAMSAFDSPVFEPDPVRRSLESMCYM
jgi:hypothetical protein